MPDAIKVDPLTEIPKPPAWWPLEAVELYQHKGQLLLAHNMLTELDLSYIQQLCLIENKLNEIWQSGVVPPGVLITQFNSFCAFSGLSFVSRQKINANSTQNKTNKYDIKKPMNQLWLKLYSFHFSRFIKCTLYQEFFGYECKPAILSAHVLLLMHPTITCLVRIQRLMLLSCFYMCINSQKIR